MKKIYTKIFLFVFLLWISSLKLYSQSIGGTISGATAVCPKSTNSGFLMLNGHVGTILYWESTTNGGVTWTNIGNPISSYSYSNLTQSTCYRVIVKNGSYPEDTSTVACITIIPPSVGGTLNGGGTFCGVASSNTLTLTGNTGSVVKWEYSTNSGASWTAVADTNTSLIYPNITQSRIYRAIVRNGAGCPTDTSTKVIFTIDPIPVAGTISGGDTVCFGNNSGTLTLSGTTGIISKWLSSINIAAGWTAIANGSASQSYQKLTQTTWYAVIVQSGICNADTAFSVVTVRTPQPISAGNDTTLTKGDSFNLHGSGNGKVLWSPSAGLSSDTILQPLASPVSTTQYLLSITDAYGCISKDAVRITVVVGELEGTISTLFTPDDDGSNDTWYIRGIENFPENEVRVFNIYGNLVYEKKGYQNDWKGTYNGTRLPDGTYYYILKFDDVTSAFKGSVDILRSK